MRVLALTTPHVSSSFQLLAVRTLACAVLTTAVLTLLLTFDATYTPAAASGHDLTTTATCDADNADGCTTRVDCNMHGNVWIPTAGTATPSTAGKCQPALDASALVETFFSTGLGGVISRIFSVLGILFALVMIGKSVMDAVQGGGGLSRAIGPIVAVLVLAALMMNIKGVAGLVARFITGFQSTLSAVLPFM